MQERFCQDRGRNGHADVKKDVVEVLSAMLDQVCQTRRIFRRIGKFKPQERRATAASFDLSSQPKFAIEAGIERAPGLGELDRAGAAREQGKPELLLQPADLVAERRRSDVKLLGGLGKAQVARDRLERTQRIEGRQGPRHGLVYLMYSDR